SLRLGPAQIAGSAVICLFTVWNCFGLARVARLQNILTGTKLAVLAAFILLALLASTGDWSHFSTHAVRTSTNSLAVQSVISLVWIMVAYSGWNAATYIAEELRSPRRTLPLALAAGTGIVAALYLALNVVYIYATPLETMKGVIPVASQAASRLFGPGIAGGFTALLTISITATINAMITIGPRVYYAMARNGAFFRVAARVHPRWRTPVPAILAQGALAALLTLTPFPQLVLYIGFSLTFFSALAVASVFRFRRRPHWQRLHALDLAFPLAPGAYLLMAGCMTIYGFVWQPVASFSAAVTVAVGALAYRWHFRHTAR
ncbi:MAG TPA: amino acid permease, partial [Solibacterales bacterium]|nr:amino acid permease [Bryobacterales bacterium]